MKVTVEFVGGARDGKHEFDIPPTPQQQADEGTSMAIGFYYLTKGEVGKATMAASPLQMETLREKGREGVEGTPCHYRVVERKENGNSLYVRAEPFTPSETAAPKVKAGRTDDSGRSSYDGKISEVKIAMEQFAQLMAEPGPPKPVFMGMLTPLADAILILVNHMQAQDAKIAALEKNSRGEQ